MGAEVWIAESRNPLHAVSAAVCHSMSIHFRDLPDLAECTALPVSGYNAADAAHDQNFMCSMYTVAYKGSCAVSIKNVELRVEELG